MTDAPTPEEAAEEIWDKTAHGPVQELGDFIDVVAPILAKRDRTAKEAGRREGAEIAINEFCDQYPEAARGAVRYYAKKALATFGQDAVLATNDQEEPDD